MRTIPYDRQFDLYETRVTKSRTCKKCHGESVEEMVVKLQVNHRKPIRLLERNI